MGVPCLRHAVAFPDPLNYSLGPVDQSTVEKVTVEMTDEEKARLKKMEARPPLSEILNLHDFEVNPILGSADPVSHPTHWEIDYRSARDAG